MLTPARPGAAAGLAYLIAIIVFRLRG